MRWFSDELLMAEISDKGWLAQVHHPTRGGDFRYRWRWRKNQPQLHQRLWLCGNRSKGHVQSFGKAWQIISAVDAQALQYLPVERRKVPEVIFVAVDRN